MPFRRSHFLGSAAAAATAGLLPRAARAQEAPIRIGALLIDNTAEVFFAQDQGFWKAAGLNVEITTFQSGSAAASALASGAIDISIADAVSMAAAHAHGIPLVYLAPATIYTPMQPAYALLVPISSPIKTAKDMSAKTISVNAIKNIVQIPTEAWIDNNGGDSKSIKFVELPFPAMSAAILDGRVDIGSVSEPFITGGVDSGKLRMISVADKNLAKSFMFSGWCSTQDWAAKNPALVAKFIAVMSQTAKWSNANKTQSSQILVKVSKMPAEIAGKMIRSYYGEKLDPSLLQPVIDASAKYGVIAKTFPATEVISPLALK